MTLDQQREYLKSNGWETVCELTEPREIYSDPFMQHVRDKLGLLDLAKKCIGDRWPVFCGIYYEAQESISHHDDTSDMYWWGQHNFLPFSVEWDCGIKAISVIFSSDATERFAGVYIMKLKDWQKNLEEWRKRL